jgi:hypothetical protein
MLAIPEIIKYIYGSQHQHIHAAVTLKREMEDMCYNNNGELTKQLFMKLIQHHGTFLYGVFNIQRKIINKVLLVIHIYIHTTTITTTICI